MSSKYDTEREQFVKLMQYSTPITVGVLLGVWFFFLGAELVFLVPVLVMSVIDVVLALKAGALYDMSMQNEE